MANFEAAMTSFWENFEKLSKMWNEIDPDVLRNVHENYTNLLLDVKMLKVDINTLTIDSDFRNLFNITSLERFAK